MKIKVNKASGPVLDWMVAKCEGRDTRNNYEVSYCEEGGHMLLFHCMADHSAHAIEQCADANKQGNSFDAVELPRYTPSTDWAQGGPIVEREKIDTSFIAGGVTAEKLVDGKWVRAMGSTPLISAMRCYVASELGETVDVPEELA